MVGALMEKYGLYLLLVSIGLLFRCALLWFTIGNFTLIRQKVAREIGIVIVITISLNAVFTNEHDIRTTAAVIMLFAGYCFYALAKKMPSCGYTESMLLIMNGYMVTALSFMSFPENLIFIALIIVMSYLVVKYWFNERKSDFWEIVLLCGEEPDGYWEKLMGIEVEY